MVTQDPNPAQANGSSTLVNQSPNSASNPSFVGDNNPLSTAIHNAILLGWSIMELKSRVQITASNLMLDSIIFNQQNASFVANITGPLPNDGIANVQLPPVTGTGEPQAQPAAETVEMQPDMIDALLKNVILNDIESLAQQYSANSPRVLTTKGQSLSTELRDNIWLTSTMRENFRRIVTLHLQRFPESDTTDTIYDVNPPSPSDAPDYENTDFPYLYLYPGQFDYANVGVSCLWKPGTPEDDRTTPFVKRFRLYEVTRRAVNCLTLLLSSPDDALDPLMIECFQKKLVPGVMGASPLTTAFADEQIDDDQSVLVEPACEDLPPPPDSQVREAIKRLSSLVIRLLDAWDSFLRESFYVNIDSANNEIELIAYQAGRSLAALTWGVSVALVPLETSIQLTADQQGNSDIQAKLTKKVRDTWVNVFNERDVNSLQLQISALSKALDRLSTNSTITNSTNTNPFTPGQAVQGVNASLEYWQRAVTQMCLPASDSKTVKPLLTPNAATAHPAQPSQSSQPQTDEAEPLLPLHWGTPAKALRLALVKQSEVWRTLILGQRDLRSFTTDKVTQTILNDFMQELEHASSVEFQRIRKRGLNSFWIIMAVAVLVLLLVLAGLFIPQIRALNGGQITNPLTLIVLLWGGAAAFVSSVMGRLGDALSRFGPAGTAVAQSFEQGYERILLEFDYLNHNIAVTYPLIEYFALADFTVLVEQPNGGTAETAIKDGYTFLAYVCWTDDDRKNEIKEVARAAFGPIGAFVGAELKSEQNPKGSKTPGGTMTGKVITRPKPGS
ncbi:MAG: hypothetical protein ACYDER_06925 [Ktedonobacteraceae bacterium]